MRRFVIGLICLIGLSGFLGGGGAARAQDPATPDAIQAANELASILSKDLLAQMTSQMTTQIWPQIEAQAHVDAATLAELRGQFEQIMLDFVTESLKDIPGIYARYFSVEELHDMAAFYRTTTGQKALQLMPKVMGDFYGTMLPRLPAMQQELRRVTADVLRKHGYPKP